jgi:hypothetical protein
MDSLLRFRKTAAAWTARSETAFTVARALPYRFTEPKSG